MRTYLHLALVLAAVAVPAGAAAQAHDHQAPDAGPVGLYDDLGDHHYAITTESSEDQAWFDQGLRLYYAFNHAEAVRSFRHAQMLEPACAPKDWRSHA